MQKSVERFDEGPVLTVNMQVRHERARSRISSNELRTEVGYRARPPLFEFRDGVWLLERHVRHAQRQPEGAEDDRRVRATFYSDAGRAIAS